MTIKHHPSDTTLAAFAGGNLDEGRSLAIATHLCTCSRCQRAVAGFEATGGALLDRLPPTAMHSDAVKNALAAIEAELGVVHGHVPARPLRNNLPALLAHYELGPWRWLGRGLQWRSVGVPAGDGARVFMLKAAPGTRLPNHRHTGPELTCVLEGAFRHELGHYGPGDVDEADETVEHQPIVDGDVTCVCLVALQGRLELQGFFGKLMQPFVRI